jgi:hypothetical protein
MKSSCTICCACWDLACEWLINPEMPDYWKPSCSHMWIHHAETDEGFLRTIHVDCETPDVWRQDPFYSEILAVAHMGLASKPLTQTVIRVGSRYYGTAPGFPGFAELEF